MRSSRLEPDLSRVWEKQGMDSDLGKCFMRAAIKAQQVLLDLPAGSTNVGEWAKKEACWQAVSQLDLEMDAASRAWTTGRAEEKQRRTRTRLQGAQDDGISIRREVVELARSGYWHALSNWERASSHVFGREMNLLRCASTLQNALRIVSSKDWNKLLEIRRRCEEEGFRFPKFRIPTDQQ